MERDAVMTDDPQPKDPRDILKKHGAEALRKAIEPEPIESNPSTPLRETDGQTKEREWLQTWTPSEFIAFEPPKDFILAGDFHVTRGGITVLGGAPGVGKSRAALGLALAGATGKKWMGFEIHSKFRTLVIQAENGPFRLKGELGDISQSTTTDLDDWLRITPPPPFGLAFHEPGFRLAVRELIEEWKPALVIIDPWNRAAQGDRQADAREALDGLFACLPEDPAEKPAILIVHHLRKKSAEHQRKTGRDLLHELAGTYQIGASARCVFALEPASKDTEDDRVVLTCCKNNDGLEGSPTAWHRQNGLFAECPEFDWESFHAGEIKQQGVTVDDLRSELQGKGWLTKSEAVRSLIDAKVCKRSAGFNALERFCDHLETDETGKKIRWRTG
jgi:hypothetical protein